MPATDRGAGEARVAKIILRDEFELGFRLEYIRPARFVGHVDKAPSDDRRGAEVARKALLPHLAAIFSLETGSNPPVVYQIEMAFVQDGG